ncbi:hypothetical protein F5X68DRAFT_10433 [Plectosphaerella plurivora]|uniref:Secreted protein n=1 Tax=Plectosphaerella plurivora TaxID=936078 RepID=A0A9P9AB52_9PEZI|nr:hypothetical protein F5X68DRAFT_10433 [Plectosphaerella plurivora]
MAESCPSTVALILSIWTARVWAHWLKRGQGCTSCRFQTATVFFLHFICHKISPSVLLLIPDCFRGQCRFAGWGTGNPSLLFSHTVAKNGNLAGGGKMRC